MNDKLLVKLSLSCSVFGLLLLFFASLFMEAKEVYISELLDAKEKDVLIKGEVVAVKRLDSITIAEVAAVKSVDVVIFDSKMMTFGVGDKVSVSGELRDYKGEKEIIAEKIRKIT